MNKIKSISKVDSTIIIELSETEARALHAMTMYGHKPFLDGYFKILGKSYMEPYAGGVESLFKTIKEELPQHFNRIDKARKTFKES